MKKLWLGIIMMLGVGMTHAAYQQQGFTQFQELPDGIQFVCPQQCVVVLGPKDGKDYLRIKGTIQGQGMIGYGFLIGQQVAPGDLKPIDSTTANYEMIFNESPVISQIPAGSQIVLLVQGQVQMTQARFMLGQRNLFQMIGQSRTDFWKFETLTVYSINLRYGQKLLGTSIVVWGYLIVGLILLILFLKKKLNWKSAVITIVGVYAFIGMRNMIDYTHIVIEGKQGIQNQNYFFLGDYYAFISGARQALKLDLLKPISGCKLFIDTPQPWPFASHMELVFMQPCTVVKDPKDATALIFYKKPVSPEWSSGKILYQLNGSTLLVP